MERRAIQGMLKRAKKRSGQARSAQDRKRHDRVKGQENRDLNALAAFYRANERDEEEVIRKVARDLQRDRETVKRHLQLEKVHPVAAKTPPEVPQPSQAQLAHFGRLAVLAGEVASSRRILGPDDVWLLEGTPLLGLMGDPEAGIVDVSEAPKADWQYYADLMIHMGEEDPQWSSKRSHLQKLLLDYTEAVRALDGALSGMVKERTPLAYNPFPGRGYGFNCHFYETVLREAMREERGLRPSGIEPVRQGTTLSFGNKIIVEVQEGEEEKLTKAQEVHKDLIASLRGWSTWKAALLAYKEAEQALAPLKEKLGLVARRGTFRGRCDTCP